MIYNMMQKSPATVCTYIYIYIYIYIQVYGAIDIIVLGTMKVIFQDKYNCPQIYGVN